MPDVLALPLSEAVEMLQAAGWDYQVVRISSAYRHDNTDNCRMEEYVVRQQDPARSMLLSISMMMCVGMSVLLLSCSGV